MRSVRPSNRLKRMKGPVTTGPFPLRFGDTIDLSRWAVVSYNDDTGLGRQASDIYKVLGLGYFFVLPSIRLQTKPLRNGKDYLVPLDAHASYLLKILEEVQGIFILEKVSHHLPLVKMAKKLGVLVACVPNWEQFGGWFSAHDMGDIFLCPTQMTHRVLQFFGFKNSIHVPCPIDLELFPVRAISGPARVFIHNGGVANQDDRKATREVIEAFKLVTRSDIRLLVRLQKEMDLPQLDPRISVSLGNLTNPSELYAKGDVAIQPSKLEGIGFTIFEAAISGMPVITCNYPPMNEFITDRKILCKVETRYRKPRGYHGLFHVYLKNPDIRDLSEKIMWCADNDMRPYADQNRSLRTISFAPDLVRRKWQEALQAHAEGRLSEITRSRRLTLATPLVFISAFFFRRLRSFLRWRKRRAR